MAKVKNIHETDDTVVKEWYLYDNDTAPIHVIEYSKKGLPPKLLNTPYPCCYCGRDANTGDRC